MKNFASLIKISELKNITENVLLGELEGFINEDLDLVVGESQKRSWSECIKYLKNIFTDTLKFDDLYVAFEYSIPFSCYKRPDVLLFYKKMVLVLEFKRKDISLEPDKAQLRGYLNELRNYHDITHKYDININGALVVTEAKNRIYEENGISIIEGSGLKNYIDDLHEDFMDANIVHEWVNSKYFPLLDIMSATTNMFIHSKIPYIKNIDDGDIGETRNFILERIKNNNDKKRIFFLTGVPGAGKTLVLLSILYELNKNRKLKSIFTSGNGPLISTLSYILSKDINRKDGEAFIKDIKSIKSSFYNKHRDKVHENVNFYETVLFDESQRSWDLKYMQEYRFNISEPELLLRVQNEAFEKFGKTNLVCSYGEGQSIYLGEESGFEIWSEVLKKDEYIDWEVYCSKGFKGYFTKRSNVYDVDELYIDTSIRGNFVDLNLFIESVLNINSDNAKKELAKIYKNGFDIKISRDFENIRKYLKEYESANIDKFYGLITSSNASKTTLKATIKGFQNILSQKDNPRIGKWYLEDCNNLTEAAAEFACQGLELNLPVIAFGRDYIIKDKKWIVSNSVLRKAQEDKSYSKVLQYENKNEIFKNIYRVLLSRGRKGMVLFIPPTKDLHETYGFFKDIGILEI